MKRGNQTPPIYGELNSYDGESCTLDYHALFQKSMLRHPLATAWVRFQKSCISMGHADLWA